MLNIAGRKLARRRAQNVLARDRGRATQSAITSCS